ncbi:unnamed protein product [Microthlaspi erraticum]|uniref:Reverse transcriptase Ty1/copia-type domain-containing protein n=1 Tax=Microthlaspi erraticum TaxID=1685480 RepID=A0A6D2L2R7_9BRAS|nr:unnamed protein product [Microthlaspi erraticum]
MNWEVTQMDVKNAFLHGDLTEVVYMKQPAGFVDKSRPDHVCLLHKAIYGLKQAPRAWFDKFSSYLLEFGFICSIKDPSLFVYSRNKDVIMLLLYVDDMIITGNNSEAMAKFKQNLSGQFRMKYLGQMAYFLGIQPHKAAGQGELFENPKYFRSLAGKFQYLTLTRPDIQFAVNFICQKMHQPSVSDFNLLKRVLRYIKGTITMGINFARNTDFVLRAYSDSNYAGCPYT